MPKYNVPGGHWDRDDDSDESEYSPATVDTHRVAVILTTDPHEKMGYGRKKYTAHLAHDEDGPTVLYFTRSRWKGNFWREVEELDWLDAPGVVRQQVASVVACESVDELAPGTRVVDKGGESVWGRDDTYKLEKEARSVLERDGPLSHEELSDRLECDWDMTQSVIRSLRNQGEAVITLDRHYDAK